MAGRPETLFPLFSSLETLPGVGPKVREHFAKLGLEKPRDLAFHLPHSVIDRRRRDSLRDAPLPGVVTVEAKVVAHQPAARKGRPHRVIMEDALTTFQLVYFHLRAPYLERLLPVGEIRLISGKAEPFDGMIQMPHPDYVLPLAEADDIPVYEPVYPLSAGLTQKAVRGAALASLDRMPSLSEWIEPSLLAAEEWPSFGDALQVCHRPNAVSDVAVTSPARTRLAYDELFAHQVTLAIARATSRAAPGQITAGDGTLRAAVLGALGYAPTGAQTRAIAEIAADLAQPLKMNRLLQGDVGSGKTLVAFQALLVAVEAGGQGVLMAPTEILARQHLESLAPLAEAAGVRIEVLTGRDKGAARAAKLAALKSGEIDVLLGTHSVFQADVAFCDLRVAVIDEQHRFGVRQRLELGAKAEMVDVLVMTATPIPRSLSLAQYGDMDVSVLDEKPPGRKPVKTALSSTERMGEVVDHLRGAIAAGRQAYWVCPLVEESEVVDLTSAEERFKALRSALGEGIVGLVHGQMPSAEKDQAMADFVAGRTSVLVATTVIEVGVNVPNASIMVIERAENFGLAQLHQLRGRVGRGDVQSTCLMLFQAPLSQSGTRRLQIFRDREDGFRLAEEDLALRGAGDVLGLAQSGLPRFQVADLERQSSLLAKAQADARLLLHQDPDLSGARGGAVRLLLWMMEQDRAIRLLKVG